MVRSVTHVFGLDPVHLLDRYASQAADWLLKKGHGVDETTPAVEQPKEDAIPY